MKIWGTFPFFFSEFSWNLKLKTCHLLHFMHWHVHKSVCRSNVLTGVKWLSRGFRWHALTSMQIRASQLSMYWGQWYRDSRKLLKIAPPLFILAARHLLDIASTLTALSVSSLSFDLMKALSCWNEIFSYHTRCQ